MLALWDEESDRMDKEEKVHLEVNNQRRLREEEMESSQLVRSREGEEWRWGGGGAVAAASAPPPSSVLRCEPCGV